MTFLCCVPPQQERSSSVEPASRYLVKVRFWCVACSTDAEPAVLRVGLVGCTKPWLHDSTSCSSLCSPAVLEPLTSGSVNFMYMLVAMVFLLRYAAAGGGSSATRRTDAVSSSSWKWGRRKAIERYAPGLPAMSNTSMRASRNGYCAFS